MIGFGTKAETLDRLKNVVQKAKVLDVVYFSVAQWLEDPSGIARRLASRFGSGMLAVRSSAQAEDAAGRSMAGAFKSCLGVDGGNAAAVHAAIHEVIASYSGNPDDQVLVQPMLADVAVSGVIMTHDMEKGAPYYIVNFDDETGRTDSVTGGAGVHKTLQIYRHSTPSYVQSPRVARFLELAQELEALTGVAGLDIEFALTHAGELILLQVRRISLSRSWHPVTERRIARQLVFVEQFVKERGAERDGLCGEGTILAVMPDWNPAEMIGTIARPLAASLYRELVTRSVWREARAEMGYRPLPAEELMVVICNHPFIDVRSSFNSFLPAKVDDPTGHLLVNAWLARLNEQPELHDKVEFEVVQTCYDLCFDEDFRHRFGDLLTGKRYEDYRQALKELTIANVSLDEDSSLRRHLARVNKLASAQERRPQGRTDGFRHLGMAHALLDECQRDGTLPFAVVARHAFIAEAILRSAVRRGGLSPERLTDFKSAIQTVSRDLIRDYDSVCSGELTAAAFMARYGHLRPGTYDITSLRYDERDDLFSARPSRGQAEPLPSFALQETERSSLNRLLSEAGFSLNADGLVEYCRLAISGREYAKFVFTRNLSDALHGLVRWGDSEGLGRDDLSFIPWEAMARTLVSPLRDHPDRHFLEVAENGRREIEEAETVRLSYLIRSVRDIYVATLHRSVPNFVGQQRVTGEVLQLDARSRATVDLYGKIVCIENADPGFDWIFARGIRGLITKFGGANSHMTIRCAEFGLPAAIGCGEQTYQRLISARMVEINGAEKVLRPVQGV